jgi:hypothetical protein
VQNLCPILNTEQMVSNQHVSNSASATDVTLNVSRPVAVTFIDGNFGPGRGPQ